ncbi:MAG: hypothetical protein PF904_05440 [Kiritimatiellae bacterium]|jgi:hypothetical protein|nr:hypothetical protein [Kiritimatiellia bacterium]
MKTKQPFSLTFITTLRASVTLLTWCVCLSACVTRAENYYVNDGSTSNDLFCSAAGSDTQDGLSPETPVASLQTILDGETPLGPGDTVYVDTGTYLLTNNINIEARHSGERNAPIVIRGVPRQTVLSRQAGGEYAYSMANYADHIVITGFTFTGGDAGLFIDSSSCSDATVTNNIFHGSSDVGLVIEPYSTGYTCGGQFLITHNLMYDTGDGMRLEIFTEMPDDYFTIINNTILVTNGAAICMGDLMTKPDVRNNILSAESGGACFKANGDDDYSIPYSDYNNLWAHNGGSVAKVTVFGTERVLDTLADWQRFTQTEYYGVRDAHSFSRDPAFADAANADFHLKSSGGRWQPEEGSATGGVWVADQDVHSPCVDAAEPDYYYYYIEQLALESDPYDYMEELTLEPDPNGGRKNMGFYGGTPEASKAALGRSLLAMAPDLVTELQYSQPVYWNLSGQDWSSNDTLRIDYSIDSSQTWHNITNGIEAFTYTCQYSWERPPETFDSANGCWVRVASQSDITINDAAFLPPEPPVTYYVNDYSRVGDVWCTTTGYDGYDGLSSNSPMATIQEVISRYSPRVGDTILVDAGTYPLYDDLVLPDTGAGSGPSNKRFRLIGAGGSRTILSRQYPSAGSCCIRVEQDFTQIEGIVCRGAEEGIVIDPATCRNATLAYNVITDNSGYGITVLPDTVNDGVDTYEIRNNLILGNGNGMNLQASSGYHRAYFTVKNNTITVFKGTGIACGGRPEGTTLLNNIVAVKGPTGCCLSINVADALASSDYNNLYLYGGAIAARWVSGGITRTALTLADWKKNGYDASSICRDPLFVSLSTDDYHLRSMGGSWHSGKWTADSDTSPCVDTGDPTSDFLNEPVPNGNCVNMGAYGDTLEASRSTEQRKLILFSPRGVVTWSSEIPIKWTPSGTGWQENDTVIIEVGTSDGTWTPLSGASSLPYNNGTFPLEITNPSDMEGSVLLRVVYKDDATVSDTSSFIVQRLVSTYYVNDTSTNGDWYCTAPGSTNYTGKAPDQPLPSLADVLSRYTLGAGDTVYVDQGTYLLTNNTVIDSYHKGSTDAPIHILGTGNGTVLSRLPEAGGNTRICLEVNADFIHIEGLTCLAGDIGISVNASFARHAELIGNTCQSNTVAGIRVIPTMASISGEQYQILQNVVSGPGDGLYLQGTYDVFGTFNNPDSRTVFVVENNTLVCDGDGDGIVVLNASRKKKSRINLLKNNLVHVTQPGHACIVTLPGTLHYSDFNNLFVQNEASIGAWQSTPTNRTAFAILSDWQSANGQDAHSLSANGQFVNPVDGNYRVQPNSPCVDAGVNSFWMFDAVDRDGFPRITGKTADIGAYELNMTSSIRLFLEGPFQTGTDSMSTALTTNQSISTTSPYGDDPRTANGIPDNVTDWVLVQFRKTPYGSAVISRSTFLRSDGWLLNDDGKRGLDIDLPPGASYYVVVKHRNHLAAMSAEPVAFDEQLLLYDFSTNSSAYFGGSNGCVAVSGETGTFWALRAGDSDGDGKIRTVDHAISLSQTNAIGYWRGDADMDGTVTLTDTRLIQSNLWHASSMPNAQTMLQPALRLIPSRRTLTVGENLTLWSGVSSLTADATTSLPPDGGGTTSTPAGTSNLWAFVQNMSSNATLVPEGFDTATYTAGEVTGRTDIVESWDAYDRLGRAFLNVISTQNVATAGKVLIVAGRKSAEDTLWPTTDYLADSAYSTLRYRGFSKENILYLNPEPDQDVDGNGELDDIDEAATFETMAETITNGLANSDQVFIYLVDHGGNSSGTGYFRLNSSETVTAIQLDDWLDTLQNTYTNMRMTILLDFCYAGSFLPDLTYTGTASRIVVAACNDNQPSYFVAGGLVSFSGAFFSGVLLGYDVMQSFTLAESAMSFYQTAQLDDDNSGSYTTNDSSVATGTYIGPTFVAGGDAPQIGEVCGNQVLTDETAASLWIGSITALHPISQAWCLIVPPGHNPNPDDPVTDLPQLELVYDSTSGRYGVTYDGFTTPGPYQVQFYVQDEAGNVSAPQQSYVTQIGYDDRVILVAGSETNTPAWPAIDYLTQLAYSTLRLRLFTPENICILSPDTVQDLDGDGTNDVTAASSLASLQDALTNWAGTNATDRLTVYLIGEGENNTFKINETECLTTNLLASWIHDYQTTNPIPVNVILDFSGAGAFVPALADIPLAETSPDATRIVLASARAGREALLANDGTVSFSQYLLSGVISGETLGDAYTAARRAIRRVSGNVRQRAMVDDNFNGIANEKNIDGLLANETYLGSAFVTGADSPEIGEVIPLTALEAPGTPITIWAANVAGMTEISNVWCVITIPGSLETASLPKLDLVWNSAADRYEAELTGPHPKGTTILTFYAQDILGEISDPVQSELLLADAYEPDDTPETASLYDGSAQQHNFHTDNDTDWTRVYLVTNFIYDFETYHFSENLDTVLDLYRELPDGTLELLDHVDEEASDLGEYTGIDYPSAGWYWTRVTLFTGATNTPIGTYELSIEIPAADGLTSLIVLGLDDVVAAALPSNSTASVSGLADKAFNGSTAVAFSGLTNGTYLVEVPTPTNFFPREDPNTPNQVQSLTNTYYANPREVTVSGGWILTGFEMISAVNVTSGVVRDAFTHAFLENAQISFTAASGSLNGTVVTGGVILTSYSTNWLSNTAGQYPDSITLGACNWDLGVTLSGYTPYTQVGAVSNPAAGDELDLGTTYLTPVDANSNSVADAWEDIYFSGGMSETEDSDSDGLNNLSEYLCGTDPTNALSVLQFTNCTGTASMAWGTVGGRSYQIMAVTSLVNFATITTNGPWEASHDQESMEWTDPDASLYKSRFYRIRLDNP